MGKSRLPVVLTLLALSAPLARAVPGANLWEAIGSGWGMIIPAPVYQVGNPGAHFFDALVLLLIIFGFVWEVGTRFAKLPKATTIGLGLLLWAPLVIWLYNNRLLFHNIFTILGGVLIATMALAALLLGSFKRFGKDSGKWKALAILLAAFITFSFFLPLIQAADARTEAEVGAKEWAEAIAGLTLPLILLLLVIGLVGGIALGRSGDGISLGGSGLPRGPKQPKEGGGSSWWKKATKIFEKSEDSEDDDLEKDEGRLRKMRKWFAKKQPHRKPRKHIEHLRELENKLLAQELAFNSNVSRSVEELTRYTQRIKASVEAVKQQVQRYINWKKLSEQESLPAQYQASLDHVADSWKQTLLRVAASVQRYVEQGKQWEERVADALKNEDRELKAELKERHEEIKGLLKQSEAIEKLIGAGHHHKLSEYIQGENRYALEFQSELVTDVQQQRQYIEDFERDITAAREFRKRLQTLEHQYAERLQQVENLQDAVKDGQARIEHELTQLEERYQNASEQVSQGIKETDAHKMDQALSEINAAQMMGQQAFQTVQRVQKAAESLVQAYQQLSRMEAEEDNFEHQDMVYLQQLVAESEVNTLFLRLLNHVHAAGKEIDGALSGIRSEDDATAKHPLVQREEKRLRRNLSRLAHDVQDAKQNIAASEAQLTAQGATPADAFAHAQQAADSVLQLIQRTVSGLDAAVTKAAQRRKVWIRQHPEEELEGAQAIMQKITRANRGRWRGNG